MQSPSLEALTEMVQKLYLIDYSCHLHFLLQPPIYDQIYQEISYLKINDARS
jgi:hypothetical protein